MQRTLGIIGGSGLYDIAGLTGARWEQVETPWGAPSDALLTGHIGETRIVFLPRHGRGHVHSPSAIPYRANIDALKRLGVTDVVSISAVGSFRQALAPGHFVIVDQFIDRTFAREKSFFGTGCVAHVGFGHPTCTRLGDAVAAAGAAAGLTLHRGGTYLAMEGPQFSTHAESLLYKNWGCSVVGMTAMPEAKLAREAEMCYATVAMVTDYDSWHPDHDSVDVAAVIATLGANSAGGKALVGALPAALGPAGSCPCGCDRALDNAIMTAPDKRDPALLAKLDAVAGRIL
ncbi:5'-methylthioadenosine phosphorylase [Ketogulonicigenium robustum]|uniref:S-methyl-5'-thioadenosine phosphorylase n=1 Tax=Ketogulonicigenium robustum TaxID=92947 RepID=A0A1W6NY32_9RHOB|nr:S-methyl-5'-thioadenosine phosphorylase [Ketogulonicigenium robustum]ARO13927.1 5'-methylthioadenosine phosphorylase [Ketogulonicigenium robustum]